MSVRTTQVLISGAGPVGLATAIELGLRGIECVLVEPRRELTRLRPRAKTLNMRTMEHLRRWGLEQELRARAPLSTSWSQDVAFTTTVLGTEITRFTGVLGLADPDDVSPVLGQQLPQYVLEELLREVVSQMPTCTVLSGWRVAAVSQHEESMSVEVRDEEDRIRTTEASYVIGADGARSAVRAAIGASYVGRQASRPNLGIVFRDVSLMDCLPTSPAVQSWLINERVPGLFGPVDRDGTWWLIAFGVDGTSPAAPEPMTLVHGALGKERQVEIISTDPWIARMELADRCRVGRAFLVGDAAHLNPPFGGHGLNTGIGDAVDVGWKLAAALDGWGGPALLDSYEVERRGLQQRVIEEATANMAVLSAELLRADLDDPGPRGHAARAALAEEIHTTKRPEYFSLDLVLGHRYEHSPVIPDEAAKPGADTDVASRARAGRRLPHYWVSEELSTLDLVGPGYTVLVLDDEPVDSLEHAAADAGVPLRIERRYDPDLADTVGASIVVVRPDQVVAWHGSTVPVNPRALIATLAGTATLQPSTSTTGT